MCRSLKLFGLHYYGDFRMIFTVFIFFPQRTNSDVSRFRSPEQIINRRIASLFVFVKASRFFLPNRITIYTSSQKRTNVCRNRASRMEYTGSKEDTFVSVLEVLHSKNKNDKV
jgi:hypothetical protein